MIYTVTLNPSLDYVVGVEHFEIGKVNRTSREEIFYGGKGLNVSAILARLNIESCALGFVAGFTGKEILRGVGSLGFRSNLLWVNKGRSRINIKLKSDQETEINGCGPEIEREDLERLFTQLEEMKNGDVLVLSGSIPPSVNRTIYEQILQRISEKQVLSVVDGERELLLNTLPFRPFLIKPNLQELEDLFGEPLREAEKIKACAAKLQKMGARNVLVSMAENGALLLEENGMYIRQKAARGQVKNSVGAGDSMVAGFLAGYLKKGDYQYALKLGTACGGATAFSDGLGTEEKIWKLMGEL